MKEWTIEDVVQGNIIDHTIIEQQQLNVHVVDKNTYEVLYYNEAFKEIVPKATIGGMCYELKGRQSPCEECFMNQTMSSAMEYFGEMKGVWMIHSIPMILKEEREISIIYAQNSEIYLNELHTVDTLTGLMSYNRFKEDFDTLLALSEYKYALFALDIDKFKYVNDIWGYEIGDELLKKIALLVSDYLSPHERFCRIHEDKFAILLEAEHEIDVERHIQCLNLIFENIQKVYFKDVKMTIIAGVCLVGLEDNLMDLMGQANIARKNAKGSHKNTFQLYNHNLADKIQKEKMIEERMMLALENNEYVPYLQPKFDLQTHKICGAEALVRWQAYDKMIYPDEFIPVFEKNGFITILDFVMYDKVLQYIRKCLDRGLTMHPISLNASRGHIKDKDFINKLLDLLKKYEVPLELIEIEVTEGIFVEDKILLNNFIKSLREKKIKVSVDDFGTAYSSLNILKDVEVDVIKIDKEFLHNIDVSDLNDMSSKDKIVIKHIVAMAKELKFSVICEGVETMEQVEFLKKIGCEYGQGYVFARPMTIKDFEERFLIQ